MNIYLILLLVFSVISFIGFLWLVIVAFKRGIVWGLAVLLLSPISAIVFSLMNWFEARKAFLLYITTFLLSFGTMIFIYSQVGFNMQQIMAKMQSGELTPQQGYQLLGRALQGDHGDLFAGQTTTTKQQLASGSMMKAGSTTPTAVKPAGQKPKAESVATMKPATKTATSVSVTNSLASTNKPKPATITQSKPTRLASAAKTAEPSASTQTVKTSVNDPSGSIPNINHVQKDPLAQYSHVPSDKVAVRLSRVSRYIGRSFLITLKNGTTHRGILRKVSRTRLELDLQLYGGNFVYRVDKDQIRKIQMYKRVTMD